jgi:broad specificity phosphatase PhoE
MTTTVMLVRHAQTNSNVTGYYMGWSEEDLDEVGYAQAHRLSARLASLPIASVYTSPLHRAHTTAAILTQPHRLKPEVLDDLIEVRLGDWQGLGADKVKLMWPELWRQLRIDPSDVTVPNGESFRQLTERAIRAFNTVVSIEGGKLVVIASHEAIVKVLVAHVLGVSNSIYPRFEIANASLTVIRAANTSYRLIMLDDTSHLQD